MNKLIFVVLALVLIASQAFRMKTNQDSALEEDFKKVFGDATTFTMNEVAKAQDAFKQQFPDEYAAWEQAVRDQQKITADILAAVQQVAGQFQTAATGTR
jgi:hypothetical protein